MKKIISLKNKNLHKLTKSENLSLLKSDKELKKHYFS